MTNDNRPDLRFAMIAEELTTEVKPSIIADAPTLIVGTDGITCPRCGLGAFEPGRSPDGAPSVVCLACPDNPWYPISDEVRRMKLLTEPYRCSSCGVRRQVTSTLSDVNLYCLGCKTLRYHSKQFPPLPLLIDPKPGSIFRWVTSQEEKARRRPNAREISDQLAVNMTIDAQLDRIVSEYNLDDLIGRKPGTARPKPTVIGSKLKQDDPLLARAVDGIRELLDLNPFDDFAERTRYDNEFKRKMRRDWFDRRTGRTWKGIVEALAHCGVTRTDTLWVKGRNQASEYDLVMTAGRFRDQLQMSHPRTIKPAPPGFNLPRDPPPGGVILYVDHACYDDEPSPGIEYRFKP